ncbi:MAG: thiamine pyrophosphate-dependent dehydrogenase E1 component subunit alpha [Chloroflexi bacterium]|nr:thiamine pyrophosphate-dependent dehydrogenase E1 component subunit alpha [Chloroflexota bacterium]
MLLVDSFQPFTQNPLVVTPLPPTTLLAHFYYQMYLIRVVEQKLLDLFAEGLVFGTVHTSIGQEVCDVGVMNVLDVTKDVVFSNHRAHGQYLLYTDDVNGLIAEVMGKKSGVCHGIGGSQHLHQRNMFTNGIQGGIVPNAVGAALAEKLKQSGAIVVVFLGDGTMGQGTVYESFNMASLWSVPILFVLQDNNIAQSTPKRLEHAGELASRANSFQIECSVTKGEDVLEVYAAAAQAIAYVRQEQRPFFLVLEALRLGPHSKGDDTRPLAEMEQLKQRDPLPRLAAQLPPETRREIEEQVRYRVQAAVEQALAADFPTLKSLSLEAERG